MNAIALNMTPIIQTFWVNVFHLTAVRLQTIEI